VQVVVGGKVPLPGRVDAEHVPPCQLLALVPVQAAGQPAPSPGTSNGSSPPKTIFISFLDNFFILKV
jgi:hypothetical protein